DLFVKHRVQSGRPGDAQQESCHRTFLLSLQATKGQGMCDSRGYRANAWHISAAWCAPSPTKWGSTPNPANDVVGKGLARRSAVRGSGRIERVEDRDHLAIGCARVGEIALAFQEGRDSNVSGGRAGLACAAQSQSPIRRPDRHDNVASGKGAKASPTRAPRHRSRGRHRRPSRSKRANSAFLIPLAPAITAPNASPANSP